MKCFDKSDEDRQRPIEMVSLETYQETFALFRDNFTDSDYINKLNTELFNILYSRKEETRKTLFLQFYSILAEVHEYEEGHVRLYMLLHLDPIVADEILGKHSNNEKKNQIAVSFRED